VIKITFKRSTANKEHAEIPTAVNPFNVITKSGNYVRAWRLKSYTKTNTL